MPEQIPHSPHAEPGALTRGLRPRHVQLIAIGGTIGVGLFLGSARAIQHAGPGLILAYAIAGAMVFFVMRGLGELLLYRPIAGSFAHYAHEFIGPFFGFATGWSYWFLWVVTAMAEVTAIGIYVHYWFPGVPQWVSALTALLVLYATNMLAVRVFGELEFWFALAKVIAIVVLIGAGLGVILFDLGPLGATAGFSNLWDHGGFLPFGIVGVLLSMQIVAFAYSGVELVGVTAGEVRDPVNVLPRAINGVIYRILIFYVGALIIIMSLIPWSELHPQMSPFVVAYEKLGVAGAADIVNLIVISAAASSCNSGVFSTGRMLHALALKRQAPGALAVLNRRHVPARCIHVSTAAMLIGVALNYLVPEEVFLWVTSVVLIGMLWTWSMIMLAHRGYRRAVREGRVPAVAFRMPGAPWATWLVLALIIAIAALLALDPATRVALYVAPVWFGILILAYARLKSRNAATGRG